MDPPILPEHDLVSALRGGTTWLVRNRLTGDLAVLRRVRTPARAARRRAEALARAGVPVALVALGGAPHALRPYRPGATAAELLGDGVAWPVRLRAARAAAAAVAALQARGAFHGDLHPGNVAMGEDGVAALLDGVDGPDLHDPPPGAAGFAPAEVVRGAGPGPAADAFALAALAHALLARPPFAADDALAAARRVLFDAPVRLAVLRPDLDPRACDLLDRALAARPRSRPGVAELAAALEAIEGTAAEIVRAAPPEVVPVPVGDVVPAPLEEVAPPRLENIVPSPPPGDPSTPFVPSPSASGPETAHPERGPREARPQSKDAPGERSRGARDEPSIGARGPHRVLPVLHALRAGVAVSLRRAAGTPLGRVALAAVPLAALAALGLGLAGEPGYAAQVERLLDAGDVSRAAAAVDRAAASRPREPWIEKLRGDVACARGDGEGCLARYRAALAARPGLGSDARLRANVLRLLGREGSAAVRVAALVPGIDGELGARTRSDDAAVRWGAVRALEQRGEADRIDYADVYARDLEGDTSCAEKRAAAAKLAELRDPRVLPRLEAAGRREGGLLGFFCAGDAVRRAIAATRAVAAR